MLRSLALQQLDTVLGPWRSVPWSRPSSGWLRAVRHALGMTTRQLAKSVGVTQATVVDAERTEAKGRYHTRDAAAIRRSSRMRGAVRPRPPATPRRNG